jgi:hypothetical protein
VSDALRAETETARGGPPTSRRRIRPPDPAVRGTTLAYMHGGSDEAVRRLVHLAFRDAHTALDLTYAAGRFWRDPLPPGLVVVSNNLDPAAATDLHVDFTASGLPTAAYDLVVYDPPHIADGGAQSIMARRYGTIRTSTALRELIGAGAREAWRLSSVGILVKVADHAHGGLFLDESDWIRQAVGVPLYTRLATVKSSYLRFGRHRAERVPRNNGAVYLVFRHDGPQHRDFDAAYRLQALRLAGPPTSENLCRVCNGPLPPGRADRATCSNACRQRAYRRRLRS